MFIQFHKLSVSACFSEFAICNQDEDGTYACVCKEGWDNPDACDQQGQFDDIDVDLYLIGMVTC